MIWGLKCHQNNSQMVSDGYAQYEEAEVDRLVATVESRYNAVVGVQETGPHYKWIAL